MLSAVKSSLMHADDITAFSCVTGGWSCLQTQAERERVPVLFNQVSITLFCIFFPSNRMISSLFVFVSVQIAFDPGHSSCRALWTRRCGLRPLISVATSNDCRCCEDTRHGTRVPLMLTMILVVTALHLGTCAMIDWLSVLRIFVAGARALD